jgi:Ser/Thr protein kinase RdoA (MazF antagonist)
MKESIIQKAVALWPLHVQQIELAAQRENTIYRVEDNTGCSWALRCHRPGYHDAAALESEMQWMAALADRGIMVPAPLLSRSGRFIENIDDTHFDMLSWLPGKPMGSATAMLDVEDRSSALFNLGAALAKLHAASDQWTPPQSFKRHAWDKEGLLGDKPFWGRFWDNPHLTASERDSLTQARYRATEKLQKHHANLDYGLIHADPVRENVLLNGHDICLIDFDDGGYGYRLFDLATVLLKCRLERDVDHLTAQLISGYHSVRRLDVEQLGLMLALRAFTYIGWIVPRLSEPWAPQRFERFKQDAFFYADKLIHSASF